MERAHIFSIAMIASAIAGLTSPFTFIVWILSPLWAPVGLFDNREALLFLSMMVVSTTALLLAGVPAALYERLVGDPDGRSALWVWAASAGLVMLAGLAWRFGAVAAG